MAESDYMQFRGKCQEACQDAVRRDSGLRIVRGWYYCPVWGKQAHWWCVKPDGTIMDPTVRQFPTKGVGAEYKEFDGYVDCEYCGQDILLDDAYRYEQHIYCSSACFGHDVGF